MSPAVGYGAWARKPKLLRKSEDGASRHKTRFRRVCQSLQICGSTPSPTGGGFHTKDEHVELASFAPKAEALLRFLHARFLSRSVG